MSLTIKLHGVRGSLPTPILPSQRKESTVELLHQFAQFSKINPNAGVDDFVKTIPNHQIQGHGGNTSCVEVSTPKQSVIVDAGTGIRYLIPSMMAAGGAKGKAVINIFMTHFHWDHIMGLPFFVPLYIPGNHVHFYAVQDDLETVIRALFKRPFFPVPFEALGAHIHFHQLKPRIPLVLDDLSITPYLLDHPDPCWGFRFSSGGKNYAHCVDTECIRVEREELGDDLPLYQHADLMLFDAQYSIQEAMEKKNWGHSSATRGLEIAYREKIKKVVFVHHDPMAMDDKIAQTAMDSGKVFAQQNKHLDGLALDWSIGIEGQEFVL